MGVETPIPPEMMDPAAPDGAPPRRIKTVEKKICRFSYFECELPFMLVSTEQKKLFIRKIHGGAPPHAPTGSQLHIPVQ